MTHMENTHNFKFPVASCLKKPEKAIKLLIKKIFDYGTCLYCDAQRFPNVKAIQNHMRDLNHFKINYEDILEHFWKLYSKEKLREYSGNEKKSKEYVLLKRILLPKKNNKVVYEEDLSDGWVEVDDEAINEDKEDEDENSDIDEVAYVKMPNGEIRLRDGTTLGNKIYRTAYKQRVRMIDLHEKQREERVLQLRQKAVLYF